MRCGVGVLTDQHAYNRLTGDGAEKNKRKVFISITLDQEALIIPDKQKDNGGLATSITRRH